jgi:hypothetical protein
MEAVLILVCIAGGLAVLVLVGIWFWDRHETNRRRLPSQDNSQGPGMAGTP